MKITATIAALALVVVTVAPATAMAEDDTVELTKEEARMCEVCVDRYVELKDEALRLEDKHNILAGQLKESRQTVKVLTYRLDKQGRELGRVQNEANQKVPTWAFYVPTAIAVLLAAGWGYSELGN